MSGSAVPQAPGRLEVVRALINTADLEAGTDQLATPADLASWSHSHGLVMNLEASRSDVERVLQLREALRTILCAHHHPGVDSEPALRLVNENMTWAGVTPVLTGDSLTWTSAEKGLPGLIGQLLTIIVAAETTGHWSRLKACSSDSCRWAFYDHSRSRTGRWCSMQICGNRAKQQKFHRTSGT